ncbi:DUF3817 domain-containing protein [Actinocorallia sp. A-T 12471]|uniref:DUF3817 domain-containing protein n=1 Tax=Actinocorallia sp. A-T 12471 TaxID=3089813 RepID=UPI0029CF7B1E|nr:DUF3817 domain-containing protein [Actinocorallia sp. A-T 12471]MDX6743707.1 DUF3817 domain-containing protein [Actinocorallia sp. A-T 12471]
MIRVFRYVSLAEATSFLLLLLVAMPLKYLADIPVAVSIVGAAHGALFLAYVGLVALCFRPLRWTLTRAFLALVASVLPIAPFFVEKHWINEPTTTPAQA